MINASELDFNVDLIFTSLDKSQNRFLGKLSRAAKACIEATKDLSLIYCPVDTGALRKSVKIERVGPYEYKISYGDEVAWYALRVHEIERFRHAFPTRWKYLEQAIEHLQSGHVDVGDVDINMRSYTEIFEAIFRGEDVSSIRIPDFAVDESPIPM